MKNNMGYFCKLRLCTAVTLYILGGVLISSSVAAETVIGPITVDTIWDNTTEDYIVPAGSNIIVAATFTLTIRPGVTVLFEQDAKLTINGTLFANTDSTVPITFGSASATTSWNGIEFTDSSADVLYNDDGSYASGSYLDNVVISGVGATPAGAIELSNAFPRLTYLTIENNSTSAIYAVVNSVNTEPDILIISNSTIRGNSVTDKIYSPGITIIADDLTAIRISSNTIKNNVDSQFGNYPPDSINKALGGGIFVQGGKTIDIVENTLISNIAYLGGAIYVSTTALATDPNTFIKDSVISDNKSFDGGGIYIVAANVDVSNNQFIGNHTQQQGAGVYIAKSDPPAVPTDPPTINRPSRANIHLNNFIKNTALNTGGVGHMDGATSTLTFDKNVVYKNSSEIHGGAFDVHGAAKADFTNNTFVSNTAVDDGDVINVVGGTGSISNNSIQGIGASKLLVIGSASNEVYTMTDNSIVSNSNVITLIHVDQAGSATIENNNMFDNSGIYVFNDQTATTLVASANWWGTSDVNIIQNLVGGFGTATVDITSPLSGVNIQAPISRPVGLFVKQTSAGIGVTWTANAEPDVAGYRVFWGTSSISESSDLRYEQSADIGNITGYTIPNNALLGETLYYLAVTAYDNTRLASEDVSSTIVNDNVVAGKESWFSEEFTATSNVIVAGDDGGGGSSDLWWLSFLGLSLVLRQLASRKRCHNAI